jgi:hypothetical protein
MAKARTLVGLDVHATKVVAAVLDVETGELAFFSGSPWMIVGEVTHRTGRVAV